MSHSFTEVSCRNVSGTLLYKFWRSWESSGHFSTHNEETQRGWPLRCAQKTTFVESFGVPNLQMVSYPKQQLKFIFSEVSVTTECTKIAHRRSLAIFAADSDSGIAGNSAVGIKFVPFNRRENRRSLAIFFAEQIAPLGASKIARFCGGAVKIAAATAENRAILVHSVSEVRKKGLAARGRRLTRPKLQQKSASALCPSPPKKGAEKECEQMSDQDRE